MIARHRRLFEKARARGALRRGAFLRRLQGRIPTTRCATLKAAHDAGADLIVLCETNGGCAAGVRRASHARSDRRISARPSASTRTTTAGVGVANALAAVRAGAVQVQGTINGYGERVGNCNLITVIPNLQLKMGIDRRAPISRSCASSRIFVDELANVPHDIRAPFVGAAAFTHKGGQHVHAVQKLARSYEHVDPALVGNERVITISDMSGPDQRARESRGARLQASKGRAGGRQILDRSEDARKRRLRVRGGGGVVRVAASASTLGLHAPLFELQEYHCTYRRSGEGLWNKCEATVKLSVNGETATTPWPKATAR